MHLLYLDESGSTTCPKTTHFVLAGVSAHERKTHWIEQDLNQVVQSIAPGDPRDVELHGSPMFGGRGMWRRIPRARREQGIIDALNAGFHSGHTRVFAAIIRRGCAGLRDPVELAFEELSRRFDLHLAALNRQQARPADHQRGIMIFDKSSTEKRLQSLAKEFKYSGHTKGQTRNYAEVPLFLDSEASRLIQFADLVAYSIFRAYEFGDPRFYNVFKHRIHSQGGITHGLCEFLHFQHGVYPLRPIATEKAMVERGDENKSSA